jgi:pyruvate,orthophosphate dikinase
VVAGIRTPQPIARLKDEMPGVYDQLREITSRLETHYRDVQDFEFTIESGTLFMLQTRTGKRTGPAAVKIAVDMVKEGLIDRKEALAARAARRPGPAPASPDRSQGHHQAAVQGLPASRGPRPAWWCSTPTTPSDSEREEGRHPGAPGNQPDDIHGMDLAQGILTATGGMTSHAAVVTRGMGKPCIVGCATSQVRTAPPFHRRRRHHRRGEWITIDGSLGYVYQGQAPLIEPTMSGEFDEFMNGPTTTVRSRCAPTPTCRAMP